MIIFLSQGAQEMFQELPHIYVEPHELKKAIQCTGTFDFPLQSNSLKYIELTSMKSFHRNYLMVIIESSRPVLPLHFSWKV